MKTTITSLNIRYANGLVSNAEVHFESREEDYSVNASGYFVLGKEEFEGKTVDELGEIVKERLVERVMGDGELGVEDEGEEYEIEEGNEG